MVRRTRTERLREREREREEDKDGLTLVLLQQKVFIASLSQCVQCAVHRVSCGYQEQKICPSAAKGSSTAPFL